MRIAGTWTERLAQFVLALAVLYALYHLAATVAPVLSPVVFSLVLAYFLDPLIDRIEKVRWFGRSLSRSVAILAVALLATGGLVVMLALLLPALITEIAAALQELPAWAERTWDSARTWLTARFDVDIDAEVDARIETITAAAQAALVKLGQAALDWSTGLFNIVLVPIFTFYFLRDFDTLKVRPLIAVPPRWQPFVLERARAMDREVGNWLRGQFQVAFALSGLYALGLGITGLKMGIFLGVVSGLISVVPYLGFALGSVTAVLMAVIYGGDDTVTQLIGLTITFTVVQLVESYVLTPKLVGDKMGMSPLTVMVVLLLGGSLFGFYGLLLSVPVVAALRVLAVDLLDAWRTSDYYLAEEPLTAFEQGILDEGRPSDATSVAAPPPRQGAVLERDAEAPAATPTRYPPAPATEREESDSALDTPSETPLDDEPVSLRPPVDPSHDAVSGDADPAPSPAVDAPPPRDVDPASTGSHDT
jgi:predicted PurR-regulated permease PerM